MAKWEIEEFEEAQEIIFFTVDGKEIVIVEFKNYDLSKHIQNLTGDESIFVYSAAEYISKERFHDPMSHLLRENKYIHREFLHEFADWYIEFLHKGNVFKENNLFTTIPRVDHRYDHLQKSFLRICTKTFLAPSKFLKKNLNLQIKNWKPENGKLYSLKREHISDIKASSQLIIFDDVITEANTLVLILEEIRKEFEGEIIWITLTAAWKILSSAGLL